MYHPSNCDTIPRVFLQSVQGIISIWAFLGPNSDSTIDRHLQAALLGDRAGVFDGPSSLASGLWPSSITGRMSPLNSWLLGGTRPRDRILMLGRARVSGTSPRESVDLTTLSKRVLKAWPHGHLVSYVEVADALQEIPWDVQGACGDLVKAGELVEGSGDNGEHFVGPR